MSSILSQGVIRNGRMELPGPIDLPDGTEVVVTISPVNSEGAHSTSLEGTASSQQVRDRMKSIHFMTEDDQKDDPVSVQEWINRLRSIPPVPSNPEQDAILQAWIARMHAFNIEAVRKQFEKGSP